MDLNFRIWNTFILKQKQWTRIIHAVVYFILLYINYKDIVINKNEVEIKKESNEQNQHFYKYINLLTGFLAIIAPNLVKVIHEKPIGEMLWF